MTTKWDKKKFKRKVIFRQARRYCRTETNELIAKGTLAK